MGKLDDLLGKKKEQSQQYEDIEMSLHCGTCNAHSDHARRAIGTDVIGWTCPNGHRNLIEGLRFG